MVGLVKRLLITFLWKSGYNDPDRLVNALDLIVNITFSALAFGGFAFTFRFHAI